MGRRTAAWFFLAAVAAGTIGVAAEDSPATVLLRAISKKIEVNSSQLPNYTCVQNITRQQFVPRFSLRTRACADIIAARNQDKIPGERISQDRLRLDVAVVDNRETFAWAGAKRFETNEINTLIEGTSGSGDFGSFLLAAFGKGIKRYIYNGEEKTELGTLAKYRYEIPVESSRYQMLLRGGYVTVGYRGTFYADPKEADIRRLVVTADEFPSSAGVCRVVDTMDYERVKMGDHDFLLPEKSSMEVLYASGQTSLNETDYSGCKQYVGESTIRFDDVEEQPKITAEEKKDAQIPLPAKTKLSAVLTSPVDLYRAAAGDPITAAVTKDVVKSGKVLVRANSKLHGRLVRVEQDFALPFPHWTVGIMFETLERAGEEQPIRLEPLDDGLRSAIPRNGGVGRDQSRNLPTRGNKSGMGLFIFATASNPRLDSSFHSDWEVSQQRPSSTPAAVPAAPATGATPAR